ncbi:hypothetical protein BZG36_00979 [Bifiguratus adelaidae]|uniref:Phosphatidylinositol N-acetylglucosaminyltransferase subunit H conserved domain-containing protein n=1 Tax=Bifiguratus adelaidae TaxID=1938954 RepID=A0A261Y6G4_9FUNG|nr:hypothetical protein BZG36_00979 [Bifiguratus adelaidae]
MGELKVTTLGENAVEYTLPNGTPVLGILDLVPFLFCGYLWSHDNASYKTVCILVAGLWLFIKLSIVREESILAIREVGVQVKTTYVSGQSKIRFIDKSKLVNIVIHEGITMWQLKSYLTILVRDEHRTTVVFEHLLPRLRPTLLQVYHGVRGIMLIETD